MFRLILRYFPHIGYHRPAIFIAVIVLACRRDIDGLRSISLFPADGTGRSLFSGNPAVFCLRSCDSHVLTRNIMAVPGTGDISLFRPLHRPSPSAHPHHHLEKSRLPLISREFRSRTSVSQPQSPSVFPELSQKMEFPPDTPPQTRSHRSLRIHLPFFTVT